MLRRQIAAEAVKIARRGATTTEVAAFRRRFGKEGIIEETAEGVAQYTIRLAASQNLIYEEMHKLFSLLDELTALADLGAQVDSQLADRVRGEVDTKFRSQSRIAKMVATDRRDTWNRNKWYYRVVETRPA
jgi:hypothetical protein